MERRDASPFQSIRRQGRARPWIAVMGEIFDALSGAEAEDQRRLDRILIELEMAPPTRAGWAPTPSSASRWRRPRPRTQAANLPLYRYVGGRHYPYPASAADEHHQRQRPRPPSSTGEFMILPTGAPHLLRCGADGGGNFHSAEEGAAMTPARPPTWATKAASPQFRQRRRGPGLHRGRPGRRRATTPATTPRARLRRRRQRVLQGRRVQDDRRGRPWTPPAWWPSSRTW